jgi:hypothetical protein
MPTNRHYRTPSRRRRESIDPVHWAILNDAPLPETANPLALLDGNDYKANASTLARASKGNTCRLDRSESGTQPPLWRRYDAAQFDVSAMGRWSRTVMAPRLVELCLKLHG